MTGETISHYRILKKFEEGGIDVVYSAEDTRLRLATWRHLSQCRVQQS
jgi:hypothetical protein